MDLLKQELQKKRQALQSDFGGRKLLKRSEIEQKNIQHLREIEQQHSKLSQNPNTSQSVNHTNSQSQNSDPNTSSSLPPALQPKPKTVETLTEEQRIENLDLPKQEVVRRLRFLKQPITLFGEDDAARLERLKTTMKSGVLEIDSDMTEGQTNDFLRDIYLLQKRQKSGMNDRKKEKKGNEGDGEEKDVNEKEDKDAKKMAAEFEELCDEDKILVFFKRLLNEWGKELEEMPETEKRTAAGKSMVAKYKQCERYLHPLFKFCRKKVLPDDIRQGLMYMVRRCMIRDYLAAMDQYIKMAIGNAPWPIGVTMVGIHERSAREKIHTSSVAHIMNDETTRKYLQSVKRLMTFCQRRYPALPSKSVEFNSLANGSDLSALLNEENVKEKSSGDRLRLE